METNKLKTAGLKITLPRVKILDILTNSNQNHWNAEEIYKALSDAGEEVGLATVYRVLTQFESAGLVIRHSFESGYSVFELNHDEHHDHLVCVKCHVVVEFVDELVEARQEAIAKQHGFKMTDHCFYIYGLCQACQAKAKKD